jgi:antitoxin component of RelBE/YafQ-DinJ toxin-antitoxin module
MQRVILQVPISQQLKISAEAVSSDMGFSSLQEAIRIFLTKLSKKEMSIKIEEAGEIVDLSPTAARRFKKAVADIKAGRNIYKPKNKEEFFKMLRS